MDGEQDIIAPETEAVDPPIAEDADDPTESLADVEVPEGDDDTDEEGTEDTEESDEDDSEDVEWEGKSFKAPKGIKDALLRHADYTRKTQEVAASRKELEAQQQRLIEQAKASDEDIALRSQFIVRKEQLEKYEKVDWNAWEDQDPIAAQKGWRHYQTLQSEASGLVQQIQQRNQQRTVEAQQETAKRLQETAEYARKEIKGWTPELDQKIGDYARAQGISERDLQAAINPAIYRVLYHAYLGAQAANKPAPAKPQTKPLAPLPTIKPKGSTTVRKSLSDMSMDEYVAYRQRQASR